MQSMEVDLVTDSGGTAAPPGKSVRASPLSAAFSMLLPITIFGDRNTSGNVKIETVASALSWVSPLWGYHRAEDSAE